MGFSYHIQFMIHFGFLTLVQEDQAIKKLNPLWNFQSHTTIHEFSEI